jgi:hypothetical protein
VAAADLVAFIGRQRTGSSVSQIQGLIEEAENSWGTTDWQGGFVPGLLNRKLSLIDRQNVTRMD